MKPKPKPKPLLCKLGFHKKKEGWYIQRLNWRNKHLTSRSAFCERCDKKLYLTDRFGNRKE